MGNSCDCGHCDCGAEKNLEDNSAMQPSVAEITANKKVEKLKKSIEELGFKVEETPEGIKISE
ncbi:MAG: hypothetical protein CO141_04225 [Candidatus Moranbacteria bacterium CG_4_9_14_3_um_filter_42_9]|nr:MAG: hypothetical protein CO141_04225 [Candidatus Moranbacteria bacterium CG_4_9_14_3_um_filter_42_9]